MFKGLGNLGSMLKQAQQVGSQLQGLSDQLKTRRATGASGGGLVTVEVNGLGEVLACRIDPSLTDREMIEDLLPAAVNQALAKTKELHAEAMKSMTDNLEMPGLAEMMSKLSGGPESSAK